MITKRGNRYGARVYIGGGKTKWVGTFAKAGDARKAERKAYQELRPKTEETCDTFASRWLEVYPRAAPGTARTYRYAAERFAREFQGVRLADVDRLKAREWAVDAPASVVAAVRAMFTDALNDGLVQANPFVALGLKRSRGRKDIQALTEAEVAELAQTAAEVLGEWGEGTFGPLITVAAYTGMRAGELCALERPDLDLAKGEIHVRRALDRTGTIGPPKNGKARRITCPPPARSAFLGIPAQLDSGLLFSSPRGRPLSVGTIGYYWRQVRASFGRPIEFHELKHACATIFLERGVSPADVALQLGHQDGGRLVMSLYGHPSEEGTRARLKGAFGKVEPLRSVERKAEHG